MILFCSNVCDRLTITHSVPLQKVKINKYADYILFNLTCFKGVKAHSSNVSFVSRLSSKKPAGLPPASGLLASFPGFSAVLPASSDPADNMGEGSSQFLPLGVDCPVNGPSCCLCVAETSTCPKTILFTARDGMFTLKSLCLYFSLIQHAYNV